MRCVNPISQKMKFVGLRLLLIVQLKCSSIDFTSRGFILNDFSHDSTNRASSLLGKVETSSVRSRSLNPSQARGEANAILLGLQILGNLNAKTCDLRTAHQKRGFQLYVIVAFRNNWKSG